MKVLLSTWDQNQGISARYQGAPEHPILHPQHNEVTRPLQTIQ
jgi:hypothetical protein